MGRQLAAQDHMRASGGEVRGYQQGGAPPATIRNGWPANSPTTGRTDPSEYAVIRPRNGDAIPVCRYMPMGSIGGGYANPMNMAAMGMGGMPQPQAGAQPHAEGGHVIDENALANARAMLRRAMGGSVQERASPEVQNQGFETCNVGMAVSYAPFTSRALRHSVDDAASASSAAFENLARRSATGMRQRFDQGSPGKRDHDDCCA